MFAKGGISILELRGITVVSRVDNFFELFNRYITCKIICILVVMIGEDVIVSVIACHSIIAIISHVIHLCNITITHNIAPAYPLLLSFSANCR